MQKEWQLDIGTDSGTALNGSLKNWRVKSQPLLQLTREIPQSFSPQQFDEAVKAFADETDVHGDKVGFINQTLESIAAATFLRREGSGNDFWIAREPFRYGSQFSEYLGGYVLANISKDVDNQLCYWISQAWLAPKYRGQGLVKIYWNTLKEHAKKNFCRHILIVSGRGNKVYQRLLGKNLHEYVHIIKEDI